MKPGDVVIPAMHTSREATRSNVITYYVINPPAVTPLP
jgi:hypothetical protein